MNQKKLSSNEEYEFSHEERETLSAQLKLSLLDPKNYPLPAELKDKAFRANDEKVKIDKAWTYVRAIVEQGRLVDLCKVEDIARDIKDQLDKLDPLESLLVDQMTAAHKAGMLLLSKTYDAVDEFELEKFINLSNKLMKTFQSGLQTLHQIRNSGKQTIIVKHQNVQVNGGQAIVATEVTTPIIDGDRGEE